MVCGSYTAAKGGNNEPDDYYGRPGDMATFIVEAEGEDLSYQWLYQAPGSDEFVYCTSSDATSNTLRVEMTTESDGAQYRCFITDANGDMGSTRCATVKLEVRDWTMEYEAGGLRTKRTSDEKTYKYIYSGDKLVRMTVGNDILDFTYDANGAPLTLVTGGKVYYYITNLQGDVMSIQSSDGMSVADYYYDAWGNQLVCSGTLAELNPLRYRGYVYDQETGFYYLQSRYYDPAIGRFINADSYASTGAGVIGCNMFAYSNNNPVLYADPAGHSFILTCVIVGAAISAIAGSVVAAVVSKKKTGKVSGWAVAGGAVAGGAVGALAGWGAGAAISAVGSAATTTVASGTVAQLGNEVYKNWQSAEQGLREAIHSVADYGSRVFLRLWEIGWQMRIIQRLILLRSRNMDIRRIRHS